MSRSRGELCFEQGRNYTAWSYSEPGEKLNKGGRGIVQQGGTDSTGAEMRGQNRELVPGAGKGAEECREAGGHADAGFCPFPSKETRSSAVKKKRKEG